MFSALAFRAFLAAAGVTLAAAPAVAEFSPLELRLAEAAAEAPEIAAFYRENGYEPLWTDDAADDRARRAALMEAFAHADAHGLPEGLYTAEAVRDALGDAATASGLAAAEVTLSRLYLSYARDLQSGILDPQRADSGIKREAPRREPRDLLARIATGAPGDVLRELVPASPEYARLVRKRSDLMDLVAAGGWGPTVPGNRYDPGDSGPGVAALRQRLSAMGYVGEEAGDVYDAELEAAVLDFQRAHGLLVDGIAGPSTLSELNVSAVERMGQVLVAMERERWLNFDRGSRHVWVNLADFRAQIIDDGSVTFETRAVVGHRDPDRRSPEFSDRMEHMVVNPTWHVPRSIAVDEYLPAFRRNPYSNGHLQIYYKGQPISRDRINWPAVTAQNWPFALKQPPSRSNALGLVKFMFPNRWNIYLHDTPAKELFGRNVRAFSHGCIRLQEPFEFAYTLLARQTADPVGYFQSQLNTGREITVPLEEHVPVHLVYRTAFTTAKGEIEFRPDIYGRDGRILAALRSAGVEVGGPES